MERSLGTTRHCGYAMTYYILNENSKVVPISTVHPDTYAVMINYRRNQPFLDEWGGKSPDSYPPSFRDPENTTLVPSTASIKDDPIIALG